MSLCIRGSVLLALVLFTGQEAHPQNNAVKRALTPKQVKISVLDEVQVRAKLLPLAFDEKGNQRKLTKEEIKDLKGDDPKLPGYAASYSDLKAGQAVLIYFGRLKPATSKDGSKSDDSAKSASQSWDPAGQLAARLVKVEGPEFATSTPKGKAPAKAIPKQITVTVTANAIPALKDLSAVLIEILDDRTTK